MNSPTPLQSPFLKLEKQNRSKNKDTLKTLLPFLDLDRFNASPQEYLKVVRELLPLPVNSAPLQTLAAVCGKVEMLYCEIYEGQLLANAEPMPDGSCSPPTPIPNNTDEETTKELHYTRQELARAQSVIMELLGRGNKYVEEHTEKERQRIKQGGLE